MGLAIDDRKDLEQQSIGKTELAEFPAMGRTSVRKRLRRRASGRDQHKACGH
jgi:hypothetical protein